jgi:hypothetical protein
VYAMAGRVESKFWESADQGRDGSGDPITSMQQSTKVAIGKILCQMIVDPSVPRRAPDLSIHVAILR